jgi:DNA topoisomerase VI subunit B
MLENITPPAAGGQPSGSAPHLTRVAFTTDRALEFFTESELTTQIGYGHQQWPVVLVKELIDNALDACEATGAPPIITVKLEADAITVADNGPGLPANIIEKSLDYAIRISDKKGYVSPTRGQLGNALKCVWAAPFVVTGESLVEVTAGGLRHRIQVKLDRIAQKPIIDHTTEAVSVQNGTSVTVHWNGVASYPTHSHLNLYHEVPLSEALAALISEYSAFNPHATFDFSGTSLPASDPGWSKWRPHQPTSAHWYRPADLRALIAAYINESDRPVRDFIAEFAGLSRTQVRKAVLQEAGITATRLADLVRDGDVDMVAVERLRDAMLKYSKPIAPERLGVIGKAHIEAALTRNGCTGGFNYHKTAAIDDADGLPCVLETAFGMNEKNGRRLIVGMNWAPVFKIPSGAIADALNHCLVQPHDPVILFIHLVKPRFAFTDHGKGALAE